MGALKKAEKLMFIFTTLVACCSFVAPGPEARFQDSQELIKAVRALGSYVSPVGPYVFLDSRRDRVIGAALTLMCSCSDESAVKTLNGMTTPESDGIDREWLEKYFVCHLWFLLMYKSPFGARPLSDAEFGRYHAEINPPEHGPKTYDYPMRYTHGGWRVEHFEFRFEGGGQSEYYLQRTFIGLPRRVISVRDRRSAVRVLSTCGRDLGGPFIDIIRKVQIHGMSSDQ